MMTLFSSPAYATVLSMEVSFWHKKPRAFAVHLPVPFRLMTCCMPFAETVTDCSLYFLLEQNVSFVVQVLHNRGGGQTNAQAE